MKRIALSVATVFVFLSSWAFAAIKPCDELKTEIESILEIESISRSSH